MKKMYLFFLFLFPFVMVFSQSEIKTFAEKDLNELIKNRNGKLLLLNIWATWCIPCREEFPGLVRLADEYDEELEIVAMSVDYPDEIESKVMPFLNANSVDFKVVMNGFDKDQKLINYFSSEWNGALPGTFIYDRSGKQVKFIEGKRSFESFSSIINKILSGAKP